MDPFTQRLMDRARVRRENLEKKLSEQTGPRKRPMPLGDHNEIVVTDTSSTCSQDDDCNSDDCYHPESPKRQCVRVIEQQIKNDTPAIASVKSRRDVIGPSLGDMDVDDYIPPLRRRQDAMEEVENTPPPLVAACRRNRLAALANTINNWEDDLTHVKTKPEEKPKTKSVDSAPWQQNRSSRLIGDGPSKPVRTFEHEAPTESSSCQGDSQSEQKKSVISRITVNLDSPNHSAIQIVPGTTTGISPAIQCTKIDFVQGTTTNDISPSVKKIGGPANLNSSAQPFKHTLASRTTAAICSPDKSVAASVVMRNKADESDSEPTTRPVSARMAAWQEKTAGPVKDDEPTKLPVSGRMGLWEKKINQAEKEKKPTSPIKPGMWVTPKAPRPQSGVVMRDKSGRGICQEPTDETVHNRMSLWEKRVSQNKGSSASKGPRPVPTAAFANSAAEQANQIRARHQAPTKSAMSSVKSPETVGEATRSLANRLNEMQNGWQKNEISEKIAEQKERELAMLRNRWKNGISSEDQQPEAESVGLPPAPPLPPVQELRSSPKKGTSKAVQELRSSPKKETTKTAKRDEARQKARTDGNESMGDLSEPTGPENFECKLRAMGFDVTSETEGKVAVADLTPIKQKEKEDKVSGSGQSPKVGTMQLKVLNVEDTRTTTTNFGDQKVTMKIKTTEQSVSDAPRQQSGKTSIYQLIKNKTVANPAKNLTTRLQSYDDSFDSGDSFTGEEDEGDYSQEEYVYEEATRQEQHIGSSSQAPSTPTSCLQPATSQESMYSETSEYSEYTETEEAEGNFTEDYTEEEEEEYSDESDDGDVVGNVDDLLDEVLDDTVTTEAETTEGESDTSALVPRKDLHAMHAFQQRDQRTGSNGSTQEDFRVPVVQPPRRRDNRVRFAHDVHGGMTSSSSQYTGSSTSTASSASGGSSASESEDERAYTIDLYRKSNRDRPSSVPSMTIVRQSEHTQRMSVPEESLPFIPEKSVRQQLRDLQETVNQEQSIIQQTSNALNQCCGTNSNFANSVEAVECHRLILVACKKREGYLAEMEKLRTGQPNKVAGPRGSLTISDIRLPLKKEFTQKIGSLAAQHFFICILRNGAHTIVSQMVSTHDAMVRDALDIPNMFKLNEIAQDFRFDLEIYSMSISREEQVSTPKKKTPKKSQTPKKGLFGHLKPSTPRSMQSPGGPNVVRTTNFVQIANLPISIKSINKTHFTLDRVPYASPIQGTIHVRLQCLMESAIEEKGFLTMFEDVGGFGAWHRRWCVLRNNSLSYWKYPDDENIKDPIGYVDLKTCITDKVGLIPRDICARPNTFEIVTVRRQHRDDSNTLVTRCANTMTTTRHQLSADTKEDRVVWCDTLNKALTTLRAWNSDAMRPIKVIRPDYADSITGCIKSVNRKPLTHRAPTTRR